MKNVKSDEILIIYRESEKRPEDASLLPMGLVLPLPFTVLFSKPRASADKEAFPPFRRACGRASQGVGPVFFDVPS